MAELESAAVVAFEALGRELDAHGYFEFGRAALGAALEEVDHANAMVELALGFGVVPIRRQFKMHDVRNLEDVALDNAAEGCGRELVGALLNQHQGRAAEDPRVRRTMSKIAVDELSHARFSMELAAALMPRLTLAQRKRAREAQEVTLINMVGEELHQSDARQLGLIDEAGIRELVGRLLDTARI